MAKHRRLFEKTCNWNTVDCFLQFRLYKHKYSKVPHFQHLTWPCYVSTPLVQVDLFLSLACLLALSLFPPLAVYPCIIGHLNAPSGFEWKLKCGEASMGEQSVKNGSLQDINWAFVLLLYVYAWLVLRDKKKENPHTITPPPLLTQARLDSCHACQNLTQLSVCYSRYQALAY